jgi:hypothetical protein
MQTDDEQAGLSPDTVLVWALFVVIGWYGVGWEAVPDRRGIGLF